MNKAAIFLTKYSRSAASSRYRTYQYLPWLEKEGIHCEVSPLFDDAYLANKYRNGRGSKLDLLRALLRRLGMIPRAYRYNLVVIEYELLPYFPALFERLLGWMGCRYIVDYDDALFHQYDQHHNPLLRKLLGKKIATVMRLAETVVVGNSYLADYAGQAGSKRVEIIPTVIDLDRYPVAAEANIDDIYTIGWIGSPTSAKYLQAIAPALAEVCRNNSACVRLIGSGPVDLPGVDVELLPWSEEKEVELMRTFDVGIMPLPDEPWAQGKCGFKLIQYMAAGIPVVATPVGVNAEIVEQSVNGFHATDHLSWMHALNALRDDHEHRLCMGRSGREKIESHYCLQVTESRLVSLLKNVANSDLN